MTLVAGVAPRGGAACCRGAGKERCGGSSELPEEVGEGPGDQVPGRVGSVGMGWGQASGSGSVASARATASTGLTGPRAPPVLDGRPAAGRCEAQRAATGSVP